MNLHRNAALSLNKRRDLAQRVVNQRWTVTKAAEAAEVSVRCARKRVGRYRVEGELERLDRSSAPRLIRSRAIAAARLASRQTTAVERTHNVSPAPMIGVGDALAIVRGWLVNPRGYKCGAEHAKTGLAAGRARESVLDCQLRVVR